MPSRFRAQRANSPGAAERWSSRAASAEANDVGSELQQRLTGLIEVYYDFGESTDIEIPIEAYPFGADFVDLSDLFLVTDFLPEEILIAMATDLHPVLNMLMDLVTVHGHGLPGGGHADTAIPGYGTINYVDSDGTVKGSCRSVVAAGGGITCSDEFEYTDNDRNGSNKGKTYRRCRNGTTGCRNGWKEVGFCEDCGWQSVADILGDVTSSSFIDAHEFDTATLLAYLQGLLDFVSSLENRFPAN